MREITTHQIQSTPSPIRILVLEDGTYELHGFPNDPLRIEIGPNGITRAALLAILIDQEKNEKAAAVLRWYFRNSEHVEQMRGADGIWLERVRQIEEEGYTDAEDDTYENGELVAAGMCYAALAEAQASAPALAMKGAATPPPVWPWTAEYWKPSGSAQRNLEKAGALFAAEWDRVERKLAATFGKAAVATTDEGGLSSSSAADRSASTVTGHELGGEAGEGLPPANEVDATAGGNPEGVA